MELATKAGGGKKVGRGVQRRTDARIMLPRTDAHANTHAWAGARGQSKCAHLLSQDFSNKPIRCPNRRNSSVSPERGGSAESVHLLLTPYLTYSTTIVSYTHAEEDT